MRTAEQHKRLLGEFLLSLSLRVFKIRSDKLLINLVWPIADLVLSRRLDERPPNIPLNPILQTYDPLCISTEVLSPRAINIINHSRAFLICFVFLLWAGLVVFSLRMATFHAVCLEGWHCIWVLFLPFSEPLSCKLESSSIELSVFPCQDKVKEKHWFMLIQSILVCYCFPTFLFKGFIHYAQNGQYLIFMSLIEAIVLKNKKLIGFHTGFNSLNIPIIAMLSLSQSVVMQFNIVRRTGNESRVNLPQ